MESELPLIIECRCNEITSRGDNPALPYSPKEIVREAVRAWEAGASIFHWHGRDPETGKPCNDVELYLEVIQGIREQTDLLLHPTLGYITQNQIEDRVRHILAVNDDPVLRVDIAPVDFGSLNVDFWNPQEKQFTTYDQVYINTRENLKEVLEVFQKHSVPVSSVCWDVGQMRTARCFQEMGLLPQDTLWEFVFTGEVMPAGAAPTISGLQAFIAEVPRDNQWLVLCWNGDVMRVASWAITLGGHVAIGLGDYHYSRFGKPHHGELVEKVVKMAHTLDREVATPAQARELLKLPQRSQLPTKVAA
ncbi:3-keto-5-aminohexanoate cleavage protein [Pleurocapsa sp. PCC 7319]|uniref:3-keto-5-aminohexanoate cleavage protein n=1 Tax=Pleurocapsa sp. PCC 7319 TaxID=118161 RepID=UPI000347FCF3|nr:3-keto-5-aminohexanoate cleavage protein [Pleurocapsa sp. PCC 7319]